MTMLTVRNKIQHYFEGQTCMNLYRTEEKSKYPKTS